jgi:uncharacterized membrane protein HdeD (DUF308 family)
MEDVRPEVIPNRFAKVLSRGWWRVLLQGLAAIAFAIFTWMNPGISLAALVILFGVYALADGILAAWLGLEGRKEFDDWWVLLLMALVGIGVAVITFTTPRITAIALLFYIAIWAIVRGALEIVAAIRLRREIKGEWLLILAGIASILFGVLIMARPGAGALAVVWLIAAYAFVFGIIHVALAFKARGFMKRVERMATV